jgi:transposase-like protein
MQVQLTTDEATEQAVEEIVPTLDELARRGAQRMIALALELEVADYIARHRPLQDEHGHALVVRNGRARTRTVVLGSGPIEVTAPRVHDRRPGAAFTSEILPPYRRKSPRLEEALPILYLRGLSTGDFAPALQELLGEAAKGFSPASIVRLKQAWEQEYDAWRKRDLAAKEYVYLFADGVNFPVRLEADRLTCLVIVGVTAEGSKEIVALEDGYRESQEAWQSLLRDLKRRGMQAPKLAVGDGALGFWGALAAVYPETREQRCWVHKLRNVLEKLPKRLQAKAKGLLHEIMQAPDRKAAEEGIAAFRREYEAKYAKAVLCLEEDQEELLAFLDFPAQHWTHVRTTNPIESAFAPAKMRTRKTKGAGSRRAGLAMAYKLLEVAQGRWRRINAPHLAMRVWQGAIFKDGIEVNPLNAHKIGSHQEEVAA